MELAHRWGERNLSKIELVMAILVLSIIIGMFNRYMLQVFSQAEQSMVNTTVININTALYYRAALAVIRNEYGQLELLEKMNPMEDMRSASDIKGIDTTLNNVPLTIGAVVKLTNYGGVVYSNKLELLEKGQWYFDAEENLIIYVISNDEFFNSDLEGPSRLRFRIVLDYEDVNANKLFELDVDEFKTMSLVAVDNYQWNI